MSAIISGDIAEVKRTRNAVFLVFAAAGVSLATWGSRLPDIKRLLDLTPGELGTVLLSIALGAVIGLPLSGRMVEKYGTPTAVRLGAGVFINGISIASLGVDAFENYWLVLVPGFLAGLGMGIWDVSMNHEGTAVEQGLGRAIMPWFHAAFSGATVVAALIGSGMTALGVPVWLHVTSIAVLQAWMVWWGTSRFFATEPPADTDGAGGRGRSAWVEPRILLVGVVVMAASFTEGTANDWIAVALVEGYHLPAWLGVLGFALFLTTMTLGRIVGTSALDKFGRVPVLRVLFVLAIAGSLLVVFGGPVLSFVGVALWGVGASLGFPVGMSAAADDPARAAARLSVVATIGYLAFLGGPPLLGYLGDSVGVLYALLAVTAFLVPALLAVTATREPSKE